MWQRCPERNLPWVNYCHLAAHPHVCPPSTPPPIRPPLLSALPHSLYNQAHKHLKALNPKWKHTCSAHYGQFNSWLKSFTHGCKTSFVQPSHAVARAIVPKLMARSSLLRGALERASRWMEQTPAITPPVAPTVETQSPTRTLSCHPACVIAAYAGVRGGHHGARGKSRHSVC